MAQLQTTWTHIRRSPYQAFAAIFILLQTFFVISVFSFLILSSSRMIAYFESIPQVTAFFKDTAKQSDIDALKQELLQTGKIATIEFVSKQEALKIYRQQNKNDPLLLELVTADILPAALKVSAVNISDLAGISEKINTSPLVDKVIFQKDIVGTLSSWTSILRKIGLGLIGVLALDSIFIMVIIIGIKISQKREEIGIMRLLGATKWYISFPFMLEGITYGVMGAIIGWSLATAGFIYATPFLNSFLHGIPIFPLPSMFFIGLLVAEFILALVLGTVASILAVFRYIK